MPTNTRLYTSGADSKNLVFKVTTVVLYAAITTQPSREVAEEGGLEAPHGFCSYLCTAR